MHRQYERCPTCHDVFAYDDDAPGRRPTFCSKRCRDIAAQRAYRKRLILQRGSQT